VAATAEIPKTVGSLWVPWTEFVEETVYAWECFKNNARTSFKK
jgi:hypothetical protein